MTNSNLREKDTSDIGTVSRRIIRAPDHVGLTDDQLEARKERVGASDVATILGKNPYRTRDELLEMKTKGLSGGVAGPPAFFGHIFEEPIASVVAMHKPDWVIAEGREVVHPKLDMLVSTLDFEVVESPRGPGVLEIKTAGHFAYSKWNGEPPLNYQLQLQAQLACTGYEWGAIAAVGGGNDFQIWIMDRHPRAIAWIEAEVARFWREVEGEAGGPPEDPPEGDRVVDAGSEQTIVDPELAALCTQYAVLSAEANGITKRKKSLRETIETHLGRFEKTIITDGNGTQYKVSAPWKPGSESLILSQRKAGRSFRLGPHK